VRSEGGMSRQSTIKKAINKSTMLQKIVGPFPTIPSGGIR